MVKHAKTCRWEVKAHGDFGASCQCCAADQTNPVGWWHLSRGSGLDSPTQIRRLNADGTATILHLAPGTLANSRSVPVVLELLRRAEG